MRAATRSCNRADRDGLKYGGFVEEFATGEAGGAEGGDIGHDFGLASCDQVGQDAAGGRGVHGAVSAETVGAEKAGNVFDGAEDAVVIGRNFVESGPGLLGIHRDIVEAWHAIGGAVEDLLDE